MALSSLQLLPPHPLNITSQKRHRFARFKTSSLSSINGALATRRRILPIVASAKAGAAASSSSLYATSTREIEKEEGNDFHGVNIAEDVTQVLLLSFCPCIMSPIYFFENVKYLACF